MIDQYVTTGNMEAQSEPGSGDRVLANKLDTSDLEAMDNIELDLLKHLHKDSPK